MNGRPTHQLLVLVCLFRWRRWTGKRAAKEKCVALFSPDPYEFTRKLFKFSANEFCWAPFVQVTMSIQWNLRNCLVCSADIDRRLVKMNQWSGEVPDEQAGDWSFYSHRVLVAEMCTRRNRPRRKKSGERGEEEKERGRTFPTFSRHIPLWSQVPATYLPPPCVQPTGPPPPPTVPFPSVAFDLLLLCSPLEKKKNVRVWPVWLSLSRSLRLLFLFPSLGLSVGSTWRLLHFQFHSRQGESRP